MLSLFGPQAAAPAAEAAPPRSTLSLTAVHTHSLTSTLLRKQPESTDQGRRAGGRQRLGPEHVSSFVSFCSLTLVSRASVWLPYMRPPSYSNMLLLLSPPSLSQETRAEWRLQGQAPIVDTLSPPSGRQPRVQAGRLARSTAGWPVSCPDYKEREKKQRARERVKSVLREKKNRKTIYRWRLFLFRLVSSLSSWLISYGFCFKL